MLNYRNKIAHGNSHSGIEDKEYKNVETSSFAIMNALITMIISALQNEDFKKTEFTPVP